MQAEPERTSGDEVSRPGADVTFKRIVTISTAIGFAAIFASVACIERSAEHGFNFRWHWRALIWMALGVVFARGLWERVWPLQVAPTVKGQARLVRYCVFIAMVSVGVFLFPISFVPKENLSEILTGLSVAAAALTLVGWIIVRVIRGFLENDRKAETMRNTQSMTSEHTAEQSARNLARKPESGHF